MNQASIPKGTRDFSPREMARRQYIFGLLRRYFEIFGFEALETPSMENLSTLTGKYGDEGDQLIFKILNSGDFLKKVDNEWIANKDLKKIAPAICEKALRYDLTVPFARYVAMNKNEITFPFRRYQIQPVWRADRPQKGRYREFYQCDADIIGSESLVSEIELIQLFDKALSELGLPSFTIKINNRKILAGIAEVAGISDKMTDMTVAIDKLDKIGWDGVEKELKERGFSEANLTSIKSFFTSEGTNESRLAMLRSGLSASEIGIKGIDEIEYVLNESAKIGFLNGQLELDITLARGLNYYTGAIFEVKAHGIAMGSICGGGRYDDLTGIFGLPGVSGIGISFGADRIYDVLEELNLFPDEIGQTTRALIVNFGENESSYCLKLLFELRKRGIASEYYPEAAKLKKQMKFADDKKIPFVVMIGADEIQSGKTCLRNMKTGDQVQCAEEELFDLLSTS
ncbi:MAG: histidine--tRNA ligase [Flavobacteriales bacterium]|nr:histidine--tRNA ligase [Flavobacteriales bacterium]